MFKFHLIAVYIMLPQQWSLDMVYFKTYCAINVIVVLRELNVIHSAKIAYDFQTANDKNKTDIGL